jgi:hypothetical protein
LPDLREKLDVKIAPIGSPSADGGDLCLTLPTHFPNRVTPARVPAFKRGVSAAALMKKQFAPIRWIVPGYLTEGLYVLAGAPKVGKSWLALTG